MSIVDKYFLFLADHRASWEVVVQKICRPKQFLLPWWDLRMCSWMYFWPWHIVSVIDVFGRFIFYCLFTINIFGFCGHTLCGGSTCQVEFVFLCSTTAELMLFIFCLNATPRAETGGYPFYSPYGCRLGYHQSDAGRAESTTSPIYHAYVWWTSPCNGSNPWLFTILQTLIALIFLTKN